MEKPILHHRKGRKQSNAPIPDFFNLPGIGDAREEVVGSEIVAFTGATDKAKKDRVC